MSGVKRTRTDEIASSSSQLPPTTTNSTISPKVEILSSFNTNIEEDFNW